jgi:hypothetical protein
MRDLRRIAGLAAAVAVALAASSPAARAEVGATLPAGGGPASIYIVQTIVDDPEPVGVMWVRHNPDGPARKVLNEQGDANGDGAPSTVLRRSDGMPVVAWSRNSPGGYDVVLSTFDGAAWSAAVALADSAESELDPVLVVDPADGTVHLLYWIAGGSPRVMHRQAPEDLSCWSAPVQVSEIGEAACRPSATFHGGALHVVYEVHEFGLGTTPRQIMLAVLDGGAFTVSPLDVSQHPGPNLPRVHSALGILWVEWIDAEGEMIWTRRPPASSWDPIEIEAFATPQERDFHVRGAIRHHALQ